MCKTGKINVTKIKRLHLSVIIKSEGPTPAPPIAPPHLLMMMTPLHQAEFFSVLIQRCLK